MNSSRAMKITGLVVLFWLVPRRTVRRGATASCNIGSAAHRPCAGRDTSSASGDGAGASLQPHAAGSRSL